MRPKKDLVAPILIDKVLLEEESRAPRLPPEPRSPPDVERRRHEATHMPYAWWCPISVESGGIDARHSSMLQSSEGTESQVQADCVFFTGDIDLDKLERSQQAMPVLVATCKEQPKEIFALACPRKGEHAYVQRAFGNNLLLLQRTKITLQTDQEEAIMSLMSKMPEELKDEIQLTMQKSPEEAANATVVQNERCALLVV